MPPHESGFVFDVLSATPPSSSEALAIDWMLGKKRGFSYKTDTNLVIKTIFARIILYRLQRKKTVTVDQTKSTINKKKRICNIIEGSLSLVDPIGFRKEKPFAPTKLPLDLGSTSTCVLETMSQLGRVVLGWCWVVVHNRNKRKTCFSTCNMRIVLLVVFFQLIWTICSSNPIISPSKGEN